MDKEIEQYMRSINETVKRNKIKLTESQLHKVIKESVKKVLMEGSKVQNRIPHPLSDEEVVDDDGNIVTLTKDKFADEYTSPETEQKRETRRKQKEYDKDIRLFFDGILKDTSLEANMRFLKQGDDKWYKELSQWGAAQRMYFNPTKGKRIAATSLMELWDIDGVYNFIVRKGKEQEILGN